MDINPKNKPSTPSRPQNTETPSSKLATVMSVVAAVIGIAAILTYGLVPLMGTAALAAITGGGFLLQHYERRGSSRRATGAVLYTAGVLLMGATLTLWALQNFKLQPQGLATSVGDILDPNTRPQVPVLGNSYDLSLTSGAYYDFDTKKANVAGTLDDEIKMSNDAFEYGDYADVYPNKYVVIIPTNTASYEGCEAGTKIITSQFISLKNTLGVDESVCIKSSKGLWVVLHRVGKDGVATKMKVQLFSK